MKKAASRFFDEVLASIDCRRFFVSQNNHVLDSGENSHAEGVAASLSDFQLQDWKKK